MREVSEVLRRCRMAGREMERRERCDEEERRLGAMQSRLEETCCVADVWPGGVRFDGSLSWRAAKTPTGSEGVDSGDDMASSMLRLAIVGRDEFKNSR
jgi:hypothetical protein